MFRFPLPRQGPVLEQLRLHQLFRIWWLRTWRGALGGVVAVAPFAIGFYLPDRAHIRSAPIRVMEQTVIVIIGGAVAYAVSRMALAKRYRDFRIALLPPDADGPELSVTNRRVLSFWWLLVWRVTLGAGMIGLLGSLAAPLLPAHAKHAVQAVVVLLILGWEFWVLRMALTKRYREFRIAVVSLRRA
jgi:hypothetical protein